MANDEPKAAARLLYAALPAADFSATSLRTLATAIEREEPYDNLPNSVKICLIRLGMACRLVDLPGLVPSDGSSPQVAGEIGPPSGPEPIEAEIVGRRAAPEGEEKTDVAE